MEAKLKDGYGRLITFRTTENGYEWFGYSPANEALSAYGLMQFMDMQKLGEYVDKGMISEL